MSRRTNNLGPIPADIIITAAITTLREAMPEDAPELDEALTVIETFVAVALRVMRKAKPAKIKSAAMDVEIAARLVGTPLIDSHSPLIANESQVMGRAA